MFTVFRLDSKLKGKCGRHIPSITRGCEDEFVFDHRHRRGRHLKFYLHNNNHHPELLTRLAYWRQFKYIVSYPIIKRIVTFAIFTRGKPEYSEKGLAYHNIRRKPATNASHICCSLLND